MMKLKIRNNLPRTWRTSEVIVTLSRKSTNSLTSEEDFPFSERNMVSPLANKSFAYIDQLIFDGFWEEAASLVRDHAKYAMKFRRAYQPFFSTFGDSKVLPIHLACANPTVTVDFIKTLLFANPNSIYEKESCNGRLCLHIALQSGLQDKVIFYLVNKYSGALMQKDCMGRLPVHFAISNHHSVALISDFLSRFPRTVLATDDLGWGPLHTAIVQCSPISIIELILSQSLEVITVTTLLGRTPMQLAMHSTNKNREAVITRLLEAERSLYEYPVIVNFREAESKEKDIGNTMGDTVFA